VRTPPLKVETGVPALADSRRELALVWAKAATRREERVGKDARVRMMRLRARCAFYFAREEDRMAGRTP
jgi:hypothetical protein